MTGPRDGDFGKFEVMTAPRVERGILGYVSRCVDEQNPTRAVRSTAFLNKLYINSAYNLEVNGKKRFLILWAWQDHESNGGFPEMKLNPRVRKCKFNKTQLRSHIWQYLESNEGTTRSAPLRPGQVHSPVEISHLHRKKSNRDELWQDPESNGDFGYLESNEGCWDYMS
ncbi:hypothetical protein K438DRAFT_1761334 [Mycena galopus ATCC 62051]|nr:hypothetical protein K438DRAFT_1761334 [Mycena galopus ATCC 62051]